MLASDINKFEACLTTALTAVVIKDRESVKILTKLADRYKNSKEFTYVSQEELATLARLNGKSVQEMLE